MQIELWEKLGETKEEEKEQYEATSKKLPVGFVATPEHIAEAYLYAVRADYATGSVVEIGKCACQELSSESHKHQNRWWSSPLRPLLNAGWSKSYRLEQAAL